MVTHDQQVSAQVRRTIAIRDGRISTEVLRHTQTDAEGREADVAQEYAVLDRAGRLQIPRDFMETLDMRERVLLALEPDHVGVWPDAGPGSGPGARARGRQERDNGGDTPRSASSGPASPPSASSGPASPPSASSGPATPPSASSGPASPPNDQQDAR